MSKILDRGMTEDDARAHIALLDRRSWYISGNAIMSGRDGREVCRSDRKDDLAAILALVRKE